MKKPLIGISSSMGLGIYSMTQDFQPQDQHRLGDKYVQAIIRAGGIPVILPACEDVSVMEAMVEGLDGILLSGGGDVDPATYGQRATGHLGNFTSSTFIRPMPEKVCNSLILQRTLLPSFFAKVTF